MDDYYRCQRIYDGEYLIKTGISDTTNKEIYLSAENGVVSFKEYETYKETGDKQLIRTIQLGAVS